MSGEAINAPIAAMSLILISGFRARPNISIAMQEISSILVNNKSFYYVLETLFAHRLHLRLKMNEDE